MRVPRTLYIENFIDKYELRNNDKDVFIYVEIRNAIYGLPQAGTLANKLLKDDEQMT